MGSPWENYKPENLGSHRQAFSDLSAEIYRDRMADQAREQFNQEYAMKQRESLWDRPESFTVAPQQMAPLSSANNQQKYIDALSARTSIEQAGQKSGIFKENNGKFYQIIPDRNNPGQVIKLPVNSTLMEQSSGNKYSQYSGGDNRSPASPQDQLSGDPSEMRSRAAIAMGGSYDPETQQATIPGNALNAHFLKTMYPAVEENIGNIYGSTRPYTPSTITQETEKRDPRPPGKDPLDAKIASNDRRMKEIIGQSGMKAQFQGADKIPNPTLKAEYFQLQEENSRLRGLQSNGSSKLFKEDAPSKPQKTSPKDEEMALKVEKAIQLLMSKGYNRDQAQQMVQDRMTKGK